MHHEEQRDAMEVIGAASRQVVEPAAKPANEVEALADSYEIAQVPMQLPGDLAPEAGEDPTLEGLSRLLNRK